jgi:hypothetical protein
MRKANLVLVVILLCTAGGGAQAQANLVGTTWADDDCMIGYKFDANGRFNEFSVDEDDLFGQWWIEGNVLHFRYDDGYSFDTTLEGNQFKLHYTTNDGSGYDCVFTQD